MQSQQTEPSPAATYEPVSRRPIAGIFRRTALMAVKWCVNAGIHPDTISYLSVAAAAGAAICFWLSGRFAILLFIAPLLCYARLWCNMLDGMVALASGKASRRGEILNDLPDRVSDILIFAGVAHSGWGNPFLAYWAMVLAIMTAYVGTLGHAVAGRREFGGVMSKPWRMVVLHVGAWVTLVLVFIGHRDQRLAGFTPFDCANGVIIVGCLQTIAVRLRRTLKMLDVP